MIRVMTSGTYDLLHYGHIDYLRKAKAEGDYLIVCLNTSDYCEKYKFKRPYYSFEIRKKILESIRYVDLVVERNEVDVSGLAKKYMIDTWIGSNELYGQWNYLMRYCKVVYFDRVPEISTSRIKDDIRIFKVED